MTDDAARSAYARAWLAVDRGDVDAASHELAWLARLDSSVWGALAVGRLRLRVGDVSAAAASVERALALRPEDPLVQRALAEVRAAQGRAEDAREAWIAAALAGDEDAWLRALEGADEERAAAIVGAWGGAPISGRLRGARAAARGAAGSWGPATSDWESAMAWTATPDTLRAWAESYARAGCAGADPSAWMDAHPPAALGPAWGGAWGEACVTLRPCEPFDEARECLDRALEVTPPGLQRSRLVEAKDQLELQRR